MSFNFKTATQIGASDASNDLVSLVLLGSSGDGKSHALGTWGCKTAYFYFSVGERHGPVSASSGAKWADNGSEVVPICIDRDEDGQVLDPDTVYQNLLTALGSFEWFKEQGIGAVSIDGATELEAVIRTSKELERRVPTTKSGKANSFEEGPVILSLFRPVIVALQTLQKELNVHYCLAMHLNVTERGQHGEIVSSAPALFGYQVATGLLKQFDDILVTSRMTSPTTGKELPRLCLRAGVSKDTIDTKTNRVRKLINFYMRLGHVDLTTQATPTIEPKLSEIVKLKKGEKL